ncbi:MAG: TonB-dependent receptor [Candidatus Gygaella obscura]|nr:TonB-dependent receptor [Candidatus Gygaella obscura]
MKILLFFNLSFYLIIGFVFAQTQALEKIVVTKDKFSGYSVGQEVVCDYSNMDKLAYLENLAGIDLQSRGFYAAQQDISLWGSNFQQVLVTLNGKYFNDPQTAHYNLDLPLSNQDIALVEVKNTDSAVNLGPGCSFGALNFVIKKANANKTIFESGFGNHDTFSGLFSLSRANENLGNRFTFERLISDGFQPFTEQKQLNISDFFSYHKDDFFVDLGFGYNNKDLGAYDFYTPGSGFASKELTSTKFFIVDSEFVREDVKIKPGLLIRKHKDTFTLEQTNPNLYMNNHKSDAYSTYLDIESESGFGKLDMGLRMLEEKINSLRLNKHRRLMYSAYLKDKIGISHKLDCILGYRFDYSDEYMGISSGSILFNMMVNKRCFLHLGISSSLRLPSYTELYYADSTTLGNANLAYEFGYKYELGYDIGMNNMNFAQSVFFQEQSNEIDWVKSSKASLWQAQNIDSSVLGLNNIFGWRINQQAKLELSYMYTNKSSQEGFTYKYGPSNTRHLVTARLSYKKKKFSHYFDLTYKKKPLRDAWILCGMKSIFAVDSNKDVFFEVDNLFNVEYEQIEGVPSPGRLFRLGVRLTW